jgi:hypothetical protein
MSEMSEFFFTLRNKVAEQGVDVSTWKEEPEEPRRELEWWEASPDAGGGARFEYDAAARQTQVDSGAGTTALGGLDIRPQF